MRKKRKSVSNRCISGYLLWHFSLPFSSAGKPILRIRFPIELRITSSELPRWVIRLPRLLHQMIPVRVTKGRVTLTLPRMILPKTPPKTPLKMRATVTKKNKR